MEIPEAIKLIQEMKSWMPSDNKNFDKEREAIDTVVAEIEKPTYTAEELEGFARWYHLMICFSKNELDFVGGRPFEKVIAQWKRGRREK